MRTYHVQRRAGICAFTFDIWGVGGQVVLVGRRRAGCHVTYSPLPLVMVFIITHELERVHLSSALVVCVIPLAREGEHHVGTALE